MHLVKPITKTPVEFMWFWCFSRASPCWKDPTPAGSHTFFHSLLSLYCSPKLFSFLLLILYEEIWIFCLLSVCSVLMNSYSCSLLYPSDLLRGPEKNGGFVAARFKIPVYFHGYQEFGFVFSCISVRTIQKTVSTQIYLIEEFIT